MKKVKITLFVILALAALTVSAQAYSSPYITELRGDITVSNRLETGYNIFKQDGSYDYKSYNFLTIVDMIGDNDGYGYGHDVVGDGDDLPPVGASGWQFDNRSPQEMSATNGAQATDIEDNFDVTFFHSFDISQFAYLTEAYFTIDITGLEQNRWGGVSRLFMDGNEVFDLLTVDQGPWGSDLFTLAVDLTLLSDGTLDVYFDNWFGDFGSDHVGIDFTKLTVTGLTGTAIPEPATMLLVGLGLAGVGLSRRLRR